MCKAEKKIITSEYILTEEANGHKVTILPAVIRGLWEDSDALWLLYMY